MKTKIITALIISCAITLSFKNKGVQGEWEPVSKLDLVSSYEKAMEWFGTTKNYKIDINYASYKDHYSTVPHDKSQGLYEKDHTNFSSIALGVKTFQNERMKLTIDTLNKIIVISNKVEIKQYPVNIKDISTLLDNVQSLKKRETKSNLIDYRVEFKPNGLYKACELGLNEKGLLRSLKYFYSTEVEDEETSSASKPRVEIIFSNYQTDLNFDYESEFSEKQYLRAEGKKYVLNEKYKNYQLKDYRTSKKRA
jgi:hypothetical protein